MLRVMTRNTPESDFEAGTIDGDAQQRGAKYYVEPGFCQSDPSADDRPGQVSPLMPHMDALLSNAQPGKRYLLLAEAGMGKTSFLLSYFNRNRKRRAGKRLHIVMASLGRPDALAKLEAVQSKSDVVAFLDAFDEDARAIENRERRMQQIMGICDGFKSVVIACRTQFLHADEDMVRRYAFEKIYLAPFAEREINEYLRRRIPWYQWKHRRQANELVASMGDFATQPQLLTAVPDLVAAGRTISELFELHEFIVESWLERERHWIEPDALRAASEKLAVAIYVRASAGGIDRIDIDEAARVTAVDAWTLDRWPLTDRSFLHRDALGRFKFANRSTLEFLCVCALLHGDTHCLRVRWSGFMRRLFVSATNVMHQRQHDSGLRELLKEDFSGTGLFPLSEHHPDPRRLQTSEILNTAVSPKAIRLHEGPTWDPARYVLEHHIDDSLYLCDRSSDTIFFVPTDWRRVESGAVDAESARLFLVTRAEADTQIATLNDHRSNNRSNWRLPTLEEFDLVFLLNQTTAFLPPHQYVWTADHTTEGERLVVRSGDTDVDQDARLNPIGVRTVLASSVATPGYFVSSMPPLGVRNHRANFDASFPALLVRVSRGGAESFRVEPPR